MERTKIFGPALVFLGLIVVGLVLVATPEAHSQEQATIQATATVVSSLVVVGNNNLQFGTVTPGVNKSIPKSAVGLAGEWLVTGLASAELSVSFVLPDSLRVTNAPAAMRIGFSPTDASYWDGASGGQSNPSGIVNPLGPATYRLGVGGQMTVWIGGTTYPRLAQTGGSYSGDLTITVAYTGG